MKKETPILQYLNAFNRISSDLLALEVKLEEDKALLLLFSLPSCYDHLASTIMYGKKNCRVRRCQTDALKQQAHEEDRFYREGLRTSCQGPEGKIKE